MELVTGRKGSPHITSQQDRQKNQGTWGEDAYIMKTGNMLEPQVQSSNEIHIMDGALMFQGALFAVKVGTYDVVTINNGSQGMLRKDLIVARYTYDVAQNVESAEWVVIQGEPAESNPVLPTPTSGDIQTGSTTVDCPVFAVNLDGINVTGVDIIPEYADTIPELMEAVAELNSKKPVFLSSSTVNPSISLTHESMEDDVIYDFIAVVQSSLDNITYKQEITARLNGGTIGINGDNAHLMSTFMGQCQKGDTLAISSYKTGGNYSTFFTRVMLIPES